MAALSPSYARRVHGDATSDGGNGPGAQRRLRTLFAKAVETQREEWGAIAVAALVALVPAAAVQGVLQALVERADGDAFVVQVVLTAASVGVGALAYFFVCGVVAQIALERRGLGRRASLRELAGSLPYGSLLAVDLIVSIGTVIGLVLLIVPGVVFGTWFALAPALIETRHMRALEAMRRSRELVRHAFWHTLALLLIALGVVALLALGLKLLVAELIDARAEVEHGISALLAGIAIKPFAAVVTVELAIELDESE